MGSRRRVAEVLRTKKWTTTGRVQRAQAPVCRAALVSARRRDCARQRLNRISILRDSQKHTTPSSWHPHWRLSLFSSLSQLFHNSLSFLSISLSLCLYVAQGAGVLRSRLPASLFRALIDGPGLQPSDIRNHTKCVSRALVPTLPVYPPHVCHRQRDWAVSRGSHMQQDMDIS